VGSAVCSWGRPRLIVCQASRRRFQRHPEELRQALVEVNDQAVLPGIPAPSGVPALAPALAAVIVDLRA
jgi:hypothetical protein